MSHSTLIDWDHSFNEWIKDGFSKWFVENIIIPEDVEFFNDSLFLTNKFNLFDIKMD